MAEGATTVVKFVEDSSPSDFLEVGDYLKANKALSSMQLGFKDVQMFLFKPKFSVLLNLVGLLYCINCLNVPVTTLFVFLSPFFLLRLIVISI